MVGTSFDVAVIGGGIAGLTAAHHAALAGVSVAHFIEDGMPGGLVMNVGALDGWPAAGAVGGAELAAGLLGRNEELGVTLLPSRIDKVEGATAKTLRGARRHVAGEAGDRGHGRFAAARSTRRAPNGSPAAACRNAPGATAASTAMPRWWSWAAAMRRSPRRSISAEFARSVTIVTRGEMFRARRSYVIARRRGRALQAALGERDRRGAGRQGRRGRARARQRGRRRGGRAPAAACSCSSGLAPNAGLL